MPGGAGGAGGAGGPGGILKLGNQKLNCSTKKMKSRSNSRMLLDVTNLKKKLWNLSSFTRPSQI